VPPVFDRSGRLRSGHERFLRNLLRPTDDRFSTAVINSVVSKTHFGRETTVFVTYVASTTLGNFTGPVGTRRTNKRGRKPFVNGRETSTAVPPNPTVGAERRGPERVRGTFCVAFSSRRHGKRYSSDPAPRRRSTSVSTYIVRARRRSVRRYVRTKCRRAAHGAEKIRTRRRSLGRHYWSRSVSIG